MTQKPAVADRVAKALEILAEVYHCPKSSTALRDSAEQARFDLLGAFRTYRADPTAEGAQRLRSALGRVVAVYDRSIRLGHDDPLAGFRHVRHNLS